MLICLQMIETEEDRVKLEQLYLYYREQMYHVAYGILKNEHDAEDAVQQAFVSILGHLENISAVKCPETRSYVVITVERKALDILRSRNRCGGEYDEEEHGVEIPLPGDCGLADAMAQLPARYRQVLLLRFDCGYTTKEIAGMLGMKQSGVQKLLWRAKEALAAQLEKEG
ncbi:MAG: RNA polymerase sigma factor [Candidatus Enterenecus sp.]